MPYYAKPGQAVYLGDKPGTFIVVSVVRVKNEPWSYWLAKEFDDSKLYHEPETNVFNDRREFTR